MAVRLAPHFGTKSAHVVEHRIRAANHDVARIVEAMLDLGAVERAIEYARPVMVALERIQPQAVRDLIQTAAQADANEDMAEAAYLLNPCRETRRPLMARERRQLITTMQLLRGLEHEDAADVTP